MRVIFHYIENMLFLYFPAHSGGHSGPSGTKAISHRTDLLYTHQELSSRVFIVSLFA